jgi:hypothetical protein
MAFFKESIKVTTRGSSHTFAATGGTDVSTGVKTGEAITGGTTDGTGEGVSVVIKFRVAVAGKVGVGSVETEKLHPVNRKHPTIRIDMSLVFIIVSSL